MQQTQIVPEKVYPNPGKKYAVVEQMNVRYMVPQQYGGMFQVGVPTNIGYVAQNWARPGEPDNWKNIVNQVNGQNITGQTGPVQRGDRPAPTPQNVLQSDKEEGMFIMGVVGRAMGSGQFKAEDIHDLTKRAAAAWKDRHTPYPEAPPDNSYGLEPPPGNPYDGP